MFHDICFIYIGTNTISRLVRNLHEGSIFSICVLKNGNIITGGGKDGRILHFDASLNLTGEDAQASQRNLTLNLRRNTHACSVLFIHDIFLCYKIKKNDIYLIDRGSFWRNSDAFGRKGHSIVSRHDEKLHSRRRR